ncbi:MAG TPA: hypothetical protein VH183_00690 [Burkholderiaceae bacterium]|jgi:hypothetical protein|nr:hypothetical protein [Burkholderiaceae bacterium]
MELEVFEAFRAAGVPDDKARGAVEAINDLIDRRYGLHAGQLATRGDLADVRAEIASVRADLTAEIADAKSELIRWSVGSIFASVGMFAAITRLLAH